MIIASKWSDYKELLLEGKIDGKRERGRLRRQWERDVQDIFDMSVTEVGRLAIDRNCLHGVVKDALLVVCCALFVPKKREFFYVSSIHENHLKTFLSSDFLI